MSTEPQVEDEFQRKMEEVRDLLQEALDLAEGRMESLGQLLGVPTQAEEALGVGGSDESVNNPSFYIAQYQRLLRVEQTLSSQLQDRVYELEEKLRQKTPQTSVDVQTIEQVVQRVVRAEISRQFLTSSKKGPGSVSSEVEFLDEEARQFVSGRSVPTELGSRLTAELSKERVERKELEEDRNSLQREIIRLKERLAVLSRDLNLRDQEVSSLKQMVKEEEEEQHSSSTAYDQLEAQVGSLSEELEERGQHLQRTQLELETLERQYNAQERLGENYKAELTSLKKTLGQKNNEIKGLKRQNAELEDRIRELTEQVRSIPHLERQLEEKRMKIQELNKERNALTSQLKKLSGS